MSISSTHTDQFGLDATEVAAVSCGYVLAAVGHGLYLSGILVGEHLPGVDEQQQHAHLALGHQSAEDEG